MFLRCIDCLLKRMNDQPERSIEVAAYDAKLALTVISGNALCAEHAASALNSLIERNKQVRAQAQAVLDKNAQKT